MSDPVTNAEVEDVLSSIRRLVSEDNRSVQVSKVEPKTVQSGHGDSTQPEVRNDRLVLTPALRVTDSSDDESAAETGAGKGAGLADLVTDDQPLDVFAPRAVPSANPQEDDEADMFDETAEADSVDDPSHDYSTDPYHFDDDADADGDGEDAYHIELTPSRDREDEDTSGVSKAAVFHHTDLSEQAEPKPEVHENADVSDAKQEAPEIKPAPFVHAKSLTMGPSIASDKSMALTAKIAALETAIGQISETWEPDDAGESDYAGSEAGEMAWEDDAPDESTLSPASEAESAASDLAAPEKAEALEVMEAQLEEFFAKSETAKVAENLVAPTPDMPAAATLAAEADETDATGTGSTQDGLDYSGDEQLIDEEALRDLVSEIVRAELQGALGERITRNVRKLVRREIHRALTAQELE